MGMELVRRTGGTDELLSPARERARRTCQEVYMDGCNALQGWAFETSREGDSFCDRYTYSVHTILTLVSSLPGAWGVLTAGVHANCME